MAFQFLCPQGHLLQGEESQAGQQCKCPYCEAMFLVPQPIQPATADQAAQTVASQPPADPAGAFPPAEFQSPPAQQPTQPEVPAQTPTEQPAEGLPVIRTAPDLAGPAARSAADGGESFTPQDAAEQPLLHIPCPKGHVLETPRDMLGEDAMCPFCQTQFRLRFEDSQEHKKQKEEERQRREMRLGRAWMQWSIAAAVVVILGVILLIVLYASR